WRAVDRRHAAGLPVFAPGLGSVLMTIAPSRIVLWLPVVAAIGLALRATRLPLCRLFALE
ncbi:MAG: hypothetical protein ACXVJW_20570, partial [Acidimicrobiia bacterium]